MRTTISPGQYRVAMHGSFGLVRLHQHDVTRARFCIALEAVTGKRAQLELPEIDTASKEHHVDY